MTYMWIQTKWVVVLKYRPNMRHKSSFPICIQWIHRSFGGGSPPTDGILFNQPLETQPQPKVGEDGLPSAINAQRFSMMERKAQPAANSSGRLVINHNIIAGLPCVVDVDVVIGTAVR